MTLKKITPLLFILFFNLWLIKIFQFNVFIGLFVIFTTLFAFLSMKTGVKIFFILSFILISILMVYQYKTSSINSLTFLNEMEKIKQLERMRGYPNYLFRFANWLELRHEAVIYYKIGNNFSEIIDPNFYFTANHPKERVGIVEFEKFPYIYFPFFILGILLLKKQNLNILLLTVIPVIMLSLIGNSNPIGPFSLFPFVTVITANGLESIFHYKRYFIVFLIIFIPVFIQTISYAIF